MKKTQILIVALLVGLVALFSFKKAEVDTWYGGAGSAKITVYNQKYSSEKAGYVRGEKAFSSTINSNVTCAYRDKSAAMEAIESDIERQAGNKIKLFQEWDYDSSIDYNIKQCD